MTRIVTKLALGFSLAAGLIATVPTASAQQKAAMTVNVPFAFTADNVSFEPGRYYVQATDHFLTLRNLETDKTSFVIIRSDLGDANHGPTRLTFARRYGQTYLKQVWTEGKSEHSELISHPKPRREIGQVTLPETTFEIATK